MQIEDYYASLASGNLQLPVASSTGSLSSASSSNSSSSASSTSSVYENALDQQINLTQKLLNSHNISSLLANPGGAELIQKLASQTLNSASPTKNLIKSEDEPENTDQETTDSKNKTEAIMSLMNLSKQQQQQQQPDSNLFNHYFNMAMRQQKDLLTETLPTLPTLPTTNTTSSPSGTQVFCDLCHKQFCNKYYLKKHKVDVHGITTDISKNVDAMKSLLPLAGDATATNNLTQILLNQLNPLMQIASTQLAQASPPTSISSASSSSIASAASSSIKLAIKEEPNEDIKRSKVAKLEACQQSSEVKCIHCTKVFFSTEFLALHIQNKHGIKADSTPTPKMTNKSIIESPLPANQPFCEYCNKSFCNKYFLRTHMNKAHGKTLIIENSKHESKSENESNENNHHFAAKVVDRVVCDICNKQVCNKYFLRTHKLKVHGLDKNNQSYEMNSPSIYDRHTLDMKGENNMSGYIDDAEDQEFVNETNEMYNYDTAEEDGEEGEMHVDSNKLNESVEKSKQIDKARRGSTSSNNSNLSILTTSSTHNNNNNNNNTNAVNTNQSNNQLNKLYGYSGASPISSTSSLSLNSPKPKADQLVNSDSFCTLCKRQFCTKYILKKHMIKQHGGAVNDGNDEEDIDEYNESYNGDLIDNKMSDQNNITLSAMSRVKCMLCEKELCNKYFLRQHVQNVHKIIFNEYLDKYGLSFSKRSNSYYSNQQLKLKKYILEKNKKIRHLNNSKNEAEDDYSGHSMSQRKRKFSTNSGDISQASCDSYDTISSSEKKQRPNPDTEEGIFSNQLLKLTNAAEEEGFSDLQAFIVESDPNDKNNSFTEHFRPSMIYLPVKSHLNDSITIRVRLRPVAQSRVPGASTITTTTTTSDQKELLENVNNTDDESFIMNNCVNNELDSTY